MRFRVKQLPKLNKPANCDNIKIRYSVFLVAKVNFCANKLT